MLNCKSRGTYHNLDQNINFLTKSDILEVYRKKYSKLFNRFELTELYRAIFESCFAKIINVP